MNQLRFLLCLFILVLLSSCNQGGSTSINDGGGSSGMWTIPGNGTVYVYQITQRDSTTSQFDTITILNSRQRIGTKTNVVSLLDNEDGFPDTAFYNIESNGDFSIGVTGNNDSLGNPIITWETYPTGSKKATPLERAVDTNEFGEHRVSSDIITFVGNETTTTSAGQFSTLHLREINSDVETANDTLGGNSFNDNDQTDFWFAPSIGLFVKIVDNDMENGEPADGHEEDLIKYSPK